MTRGPALLAHRPGTAQITRVVVFHRHPLVSHGLAAVLALGDGIDVVGVSSRAAQLIEAVERYQPDVVVFGLTAGGHSRPDWLISRVWAATVGFRPAFVVIVPNELDAADALAVDATAVVTTEVAGHSLRDLVRGAGNAGSRHLPPELVRPPAMPLTRVGDSGATVLTARELDVLSGIESGLSTKQIAASLGISVNTARTHAQRLMSKLRVHSRLQAAAVAAEFLPLTGPARRRT